LILAVCRSTFAGRRGISTPTTLVWRKRRDSVICTPPRPSARIARVPILRIFTDLPYATLRVIPSDDAFKWRRSRSSGLCSINGSSGNAVSGSAHEALGHHHYQERSLEHWRLHSVGEFRRRG